MGVRALALVALLLALAACAATAREQRTLHGPTALEVWTASVILRTGREPTFDERHQWNSQLERQISKYLSGHPEVANSPEVSNFTFLRQVAVGMSKEQVLLLLGPPAGTATDPAALETLGRAYWPAIKAGNAPEDGGSPLRLAPVFSPGPLRDITPYP